MNEDIAKPTQKSRETNCSPAFIGSKITQELECTQINKFHTKGGTGFAAEDANALNDRLRFKKVEQVGTSNTLNGPDRIVNGVPIQTKYFETPAQTINAAFGSDGYRYGKQLLEVPADQYEDCLRIMRDKISNGNVPGVTDPAEAERIVKKGSVTYKQAKNIARAGNLDSLLFDAKTQAISSAWTFATSFGITYAQQKWNGASDEDALKTTINEALKASATSFLVGVITSQVLRTHAAAAGVVISRNSVKWLAKSPAGKALIEKIAKASLGKAVHGAAATNHVAKLLRTNTVTTAVVTGVMAIPDFYRVFFEGSISWGQFVKNTGLTLSSVAGGTGGWWAGFTFGAKFGPIGAAIGGLLGSIFGSSTATEVAQVILDELIVDDAKKMLEIVPEGLSLLSSDFLLTDKEVQCLINEVNTSVDAVFLRDMYRSTDRVNFVYKRLENNCMEIIKKRPTVIIPNDKEVQVVIDKIEVAINADIQRIYQEAINKRGTNA